MIPALFDYITILLLFRHHQASRDRCEHTTPVTERYQGVLLRFN